MNIVYTFDNGYAEITAVSLLSLLENNISVKNLDIYIVDCGISEENKSKFKKLASEYNRKILFINGKGLEKKIPIKLELSYWSFVCYVRLFFSELLPNISRILHVDCDTLVLGDLSEVYNTDLKDNYCGACYDCIPTSKAAIGMESKKKYYSNGLILFDLDKMRKDNIQSKFIEYIVEKNGKLPHLDQDVLNSVLLNKILTLPFNYNIMTWNVIWKDRVCDLYDEHSSYYTKKEVVCGLKEPKIIHFVGYKYISKPWSQPCYHPYNKEWIKYYKKTAPGIKQDLLKYKKKKYGMLREFICIIWNFLYKIPGIKEIMFYKEKRNIKKKCKNYLKNI